MTEVILAAASPHYDWTKGAMMFANFAVFAASLGYFLIPALKKYCTGRHNTI